MIILDTSALIASLNRNDANHSHAADVIRRVEGPLVVPALIMAEVAYLVEQRLGQHVLAGFLDDVLRQAYLVEFQEPDFLRIRQLIQRYADLPLGFADASVIACAERRRGPVLTFDFRHFSVVAREQTFEMFNP
jgi:uncharacterized protein